ncbi:MAG: hypothetical protein AB8F78_05270 [Saprospiraceae bacterium]
MNTENSVSVSSSAIKWVLRHIFISIGIVLLTRLLALLFSGVTADFASAGYIITNLLGIAFYVGSIGVSFYVIYAGMKDYKAHSNSQFFSFSVSLKWSSIFVLLYLVVYGVFSLMLNLIVVYTTDASVGAVISILLLLWLGPLVLYVAILSALALLSGLILKTD